MKNNKGIILTMVLILMMVLVACEVEPTISNFSEGDLQIHFIDVGQGDSTLIMLPNDEVALIDAGTRGGRNELVDYLKSQNISKIDYLIGTHPHEDHIGGLPEVIRRFEIGKVYLPNKTNNTAIFEELLTEIKNNDLKISEGKSGVSIIDSGELQFYMLAPSKEYADINNSSIVTKVVYKDFAALITGDSEKEAEGDMVKEGHDLESDILKVAHHGSTTSNTKEFLDRVNPDYSVISLGKDNSYGHPHKEIVKELEGRDTTILRTDQMGSIVFQTDGNKIDLINGTSLETLENDKEDSKEILYIGNLNSKTFHTNECNTLPKEDNQIKFSSKEEALKAGYSPHTVCIK